MYGTKVGLSQDGWGRALFLLLPNVNQVPTLRPNEFVVPCVTTFDTSYVGSLLYDLPKTTVKIQDTSCSFLLRRGIKIFFTYKTVCILRGFTGGLLRCLVAANLASCRAAAGNSSPSFLSWATSRRSSAIATNQRRFSSAVRQQNNNHLSRTQL